MTTLFFVSVQNSSALVVPPMAIGFAAPPGNVFTAKVKASCTELARAVADPNLRVVVNGRQAVGTGGIVVACEARKSRIDELCDVVGRPINYVNRLVVAVRQEVLVEHWIVPADVERKECGAPGTCKTWVTLNTSSFLNPPSSLQAVPAKARAAIAPTADVSHNFLLDAHRDDARIGNPPCLSH